MQGGQDWLKITLLADYLETRVESHPNLEMMSTRQWSNVCIRYTAESIDHDEINSNLRTDS